MLKELKEKRGKIFEQIKELRAVEEKGSFTPEQRAQWDKLMSEYDANEKLIRDEERMLQMQKQAAENQAAKEGQKRSLYNLEVFRRFLREGKTAVTAEEMCDAISGVTGGNLFPNEIASQIEMALGGASGLIAAATKYMTSTGADFIIPSINDSNSKAEIVTEYTKGTQAGKTFNGIKMGSYTYRTPLIPISNELLQDSQFDLASFVSDMLLKSFNAGINAGFTSGSGTDAPQGIVTGAQSVDGSTVANFSFDDLVNLMDGVGAAYEAQGKFMFNTKTLHELMKLKDTTKNYIFSPGVNGAVAPTVWGHSFVINPDMDDIAAGKSPIVFGDLSKYAVRIVKNFTFKRLDEVLAEYNSVGFLAFGRVDGKLIDAGTHPIAKLVVAAS